MTRRDGRRLSRRASGGDRCCRCRAEALELESALVLTGEEPVSDADEARKDLVARSPLWIAAGWSSGEADRLGRRERDVVRGAVIVSGDARETPASFQVMLQVKPTAPAHSHMSHAMN